MLSARILDRLSPSLLGLVSSRALAHLLQAYTHARPKTTTTALMQDSGGWANCQVLPDCLQVRLGHFQLLQCGSRWIVILQLYFDFGKLGCLHVVTSNKNSQPATAECQEAFARTTSFCVKFTVASRSTTGKGAVSSWEALALLSKTAAGLSFLFFFPLPALAFPLALGLRCLHIEKQLQPNF